MKEKFNKKNSNENRGKEHGGKGKQVSLRCFLHGAVPCSTTESPGWAEPQPQMENSLCKKETSSKCTEVSGLGAEHLVSHIERACIYLYIYFYIFLYLYVFLYISISGLRWAGLGSAVPTPRAG